MVDPNILWQQYKIKKDPNAREQLILSYAHLAKYAVDRLNLRPSGTLSRDDLIGHAIVGLIDAVEKYDPSRRIKFETYAMTRIRGSVLDALKSLDWMPRSVRSVGTELKRNMVRMESELGYPPSDAEIAREMGMSEEQLMEVLANVGQAAMMSLDEMLLNGEDCGSAGGGYNEFDPEAVVAMEERSKLLAKAIGELPEREKLVISLYYKEGLTLKEIAKVLGVTESRVCQMHSKAVLRLNGKLSRHSDLMLSVA